MNTDGKCQGKVVPIDAMKVKRGSRGTVPLILKPGAIRCSQLHTLAALLPGKNTGTNRRRGWVRPRAGLDFFGEEKSLLPPSVLYFLIVHPAAWSLYQISYAGSLIRTQSRQRQTRLNLNTTWWSVSSSTVRLL
jgi:hypothetical protein